MSDMNAGSTSVVIGRALALLLRARWLEESGTKAMAEFARERAIEVLKEARRPAPVGAAAEALRHAA